MTNRNSHTQGSAGDTPIEIRRGRAAPYVVVPEWVILAGISPEAVVAYALLQAQTPQTSDDDLGWLFGQRGLDLKVCLAELVGIGAVNTTADGYPVHETPPAGYAGPASLNEYYDQP